MLCRFKKWLHFLLITLLRLVSLSTNVRAENVWSDDAMTLGENIGKNITHLTISDQIWMKETIVSLAQILYQHKSHTLPGRSSEIYDLRRICNIMYEQNAFKTISKYNNVRNQAVKL
ncbi:Hypothetical_protein [Hexamita inflata]|uniref:Hypothetical_protein n=1 Tax=Hexamita inflata TaxID=28002 RepID=A0AA86U0A0_9EUKA|nr:Hypothetical protein HINF_LOCUS14358 [Hexamita inflata]